MESKFDVLPGNENLKRGFEVAATGYHNIMVIGAPELKPSVMEYTRLLRMDELVIYSLPCMCGYYGDYSKDCGCSAKDINIIHAAIKMEIDLYPLIMEVTRPDIYKMIVPSSEPIKDILPRIKEGREKLRSGIIFDSDEEAKQLLTQAVKVMQLSPAQIRNIEAVSCTVAALSGREKTSTADIAEAIVNSQLGNKF